MGLFSKKENKNEIKKTQDEKVGNFELEDVFLIPVSEIPEKSKRDMALSIEIERQFLAEKGWDEMKYAITLENGEPVLIDDILLPMKCKGEQVLWYRKIEDGIFNKTLRGYEAFTEYRCYFYDLKDHLRTWSLITGDMDVVVTNQKRISESQRDGNFVGFGNRGVFTGSSGGTSRSESQTYGDVNIMLDGEIDFTFFNVVDPNGLAKLIKYTIKKAKEGEEKNKKFVESKRKLENKEIKCISCNNPNSSDAKFCNKCGHKFTTVCSKCKNINPSDSSFCNQCGFTLQ